MKQSDCIYEGKQDHDSLKNNTNRKADASLYVNARRWREYLLMNSTAFEQLVAEQQAGWNSPALDAWYAKRRREDTERIKIAHTSSCPVHDEREIIKVNNFEQANKSNTNLRHYNNIDDSTLYNNKSPKTVSSSYSCNNTQRCNKIKTINTASTVFTNINTNKLTERYRVHIRDMFCKSKALYCIFCRREDKGKVMSNEQINNNYCTINNVSQEQLEELQYSETESKLEDTHAEVQQTRNNYSTCLSECNECTFLDLGCAPGGVAKYFIKDLHWTGVGVTLSPESGGIEIDSELLTSPLASSFTLFTGNVMEPIHTWKRFTKQSSTSSTTATTLTKRKYHIDIAEEKHANTEENAELSGDNNNNTEELSKRKFYFVNGGAVQDHGQRIELTHRDNLLQNEARQQMKRVRDEDNSMQPNVNDNISCTTPEQRELELEERFTDVKGYVSSTCNAEESHECAILPWFTLLVPQLTLALQHVCPFGAFMLLHGYPSCASLFILIRLLKDTVHSHLNDRKHHCTQPIESKQNYQNVISKLQCEREEEAKHVHMFETIHLAKTPVYILWDNVNVQGKEREIKLLLECLNPLSPRINPLEDNAMTCFTNTSNESNKLTSLRESKQRFWLGESDDGFSLAKEGFELYKHDLECVWLKTAQFLRERRLKVERWMTNNRSQISTKI